jgi:large conductance mechanosensitive channel
VLKEFKEFISRGNVVDLAVAVVIGTAFVAVVNAFVSGLITPLIGMIGGRDYSELTFTVNDSVFRYGEVINALIQFLLIAAAVFFLIVKPLNVMADRRRRGAEPEPAPSTEEAVLLAEIRDVLRTQGVAPARPATGGAGGTGGPATPPTDPGGPTSGW